MMKVRLLFLVLIVFLTGIASVYSNGSNVMILHNVTAQAGETIVVELEIANDDEFVGFNLDIPFPEGFTFVPGSAQLYRKTNHQLSFTVPHSNTARIIAFSFTNAPFEGNEGTVLSFELETTSTPGEYMLPIVDPIIGNIEAQNILTGTVDATITLEGDVPPPEYSLNLYANPASAGMVSGDGNYYEGEQVTATAIPNAGYEFLNWTDISDNVVSTQASYGFSMPDDDLSLWANFEEDDDPEPAGENIMMLHDVTANAGDIITIEMEILNEDEFVGFSLDIPLPTDFDYVEGSAQLFRSTNHGFVFNVIESNVAKIIAFSITNDAFLGNEGVIFSFDVVTPDTPGTYLLPLVEAIIGNADAEDILTGTVDGTVTLTEAIDPDPEYTLNLYANPPAGGTVSGDGNYEAGTMVTASATSNTGYEFVNWTDVSGNVVSTQASYNFTMPDADLGLWANFEEDDDPEPGDQNIMIIHDVTAPAGEIITVEVEIVNDNEFVGFNLDIPFPDGFTYVPGSAQLFRHANHQLSFTVPHSNTARIIAFSFTNAEFSGNEGTVLSFQLETPATTGDYLLPIVDPIIGNIEAEDILTGTVDGTVTLTEAVDPDPEYILTLHANPPAGGTVSGNGNYEAGTSVTASATANTGYEFVNWTDVSGNVVSTQASYNFSMPDDDLDLWANFEEDDPEPPGENIMELYDVNATAGEAITIELEIQNEDEFVGFNLDIPLPEGFDYIEGTAQLFRNTNHDFVFNVVENNLAKIIAFSITNDVFLGNEGVIFSFDLSTPNNPGTYPLPIIDAVIGNADAADILTGTVDGIITLEEEAEPEFQLTLLANPEAGGDVAGAGIYTEGTEVFIEATPAPGYTFLNWTDLDGNVISVEPSDVIEMPAADLSLTANFELSEFTVTVYVEPEDAGVVSGEGVYDFGEEVTLMAFEETGYEFVSWLDADGNVLGTETVYSFSMPADDVDITAHFAPVDFFVSVIIEPEGAGTISGSGYYNFGDQVTLQVNNAEGYEFVNWTDMDGNVLSDAQVYTFTMPAVDVSLVANFELISYSLNVSVIGNGSVAIDPDQEAYLPGTAVELTAMPDPGWIFNNWIGAYTGFNNPVTIVMNDDKSIIARFNQLFVTNIVVSGPGYIAIPEDETETEQYTATVFNQFNQPMPEEEVSWSTIPDQNDLTGVSIDENGVLSITPDAEEDEILVVATSLSNPDVFGIRMVELESVITKFTLTLNIFGNGTVLVNETLYSSSTQNIELDANALADLLASPVFGWSFINWTGEVTDPDSPETSVFMDGNKTISVHFSQDQYFLTVDVDGNGIVSKTPDLEFYGYNQPVIVRASAAPGWAFSHWTGDVVNPNNASTYIIINEDKELTAHFVQLPVTLTINTEGNGIVTTDPSGPTYDPGTQVVLSAEAAIGWEFSHWVGDVADEEADLTTILMDANKTITAHFVEAEYELNVDVDGNGSVGINPNQESYVFGQPVIIRANPAEGWAFSHWTGNVLDNESSRTAVLMLEDQDVTAHFVQLGYTLTLGIEGNGTVNVDPEQELYEPGTQVTLFAEHAGTGFIYWTGAYNGFNNRVTITMGADRNITAHFVEWDFKELYQNIMIPVVLLDVPGDIYIGGPGQVLIPSAENEPNQVQYTAFVADDGGNILPDEEVIWSISGPEGVPLTGLSIDPDSGMLYVASDAFLPIIGVVATSVSNPDFFETRIVSLVNEITMYSLGLFMNGNGSISMNENDYTDPFQNVELDANQLYDIVAEPGNHWSFLSWSGDLEGENPEAELLMDDHKTVVADFSEDQYYLTVNETGEGAVNVNPDEESYPYGELVNISALAAPGWVFSHWTGDVLNPDAASTIVIMDADKTIEAVFTQSEYVLTVNTSGEGVVLITPDQETYVYGDEVALTATPNDGWQFDGWTGDVISQENPITITITGNKNTHAHFSEILLVPAELTISGAEEILIPLTGQPASEMQYSAEIFDQFGELMETEDVIWTLTGNIPAGVSISTDGLLSVSSQATPLTIGVMATSLSEPELSEVLFVELIRETFSITAQPNNPDFGAVEGAGDYLAGSQVVINAIPNIGYHLVNWTENGEIVFDEAVYTFIAAENRDLIAQFAINTYIINATAGDNGSINPAGDIAVEHGSDQSFTITPNEGYHIAEVLVNGVDEGALAEYIFENVTEGQSIHATFAINTYIITAASGENGAIDPTGDIVVEHGADQSFTMHANDGFHIADVFVDGVSVGPLSEYTFDGVTEAHSIHVEFMLTTYALTFEVLDAETEGSIADAVITLDGDEYEAGIYVFENLEPRNYAYVIGHDDYVIYEGEVEIVNMDVVEIVLMEPLDDDTSVEETEIIELEVYPNPASNMLMVESHVILQEVRLTDLSGKIVYASQVKDNQFIINVSRYDTGIYILQVSSMTGTSARLVKISR